MIPARDQLIVALDVSSAAQAEKMVSSLGDIVSFYKVGMQLYTAEGPNIVRELVGSGRRVFLDLKYHDIPNTVGAAVGAARELGVSLLTVHGAGGSKMLRAAVEAARGNPAMKVIAVTVLTSMDEDDLHEVGVGGDLEKQVVQVAKLALRAGCHGVVSSAREVKALRAHLGNDFLVVTPGVRPAGAPQGDQVRSVTPAEAIEAGSTHLVVGRPITGAANPRDEAGRIIREIEHASPVSAK